MPKDTVKVERINVAYHQPWEVEFRLIAEVVATPIQMSGGAMVGTEMPTPGTGVAT